MKRFIVFFLMASSMTVLAHGACEKEIKKANGTSVSRTSKKVYQSIFNTPDTEVNAATRDYWLQRSLKASLITFQSEWSEDEGAASGVDLIIMDAKTCKILDSLVISSFNENE